MSKRNPTINDVALAARVSIATVSRVVNGGKVADHTRLAVEAAIATLGYRPNSLARGLVTGRTGVVGVLIPDVAGPLYALMARGIEDVLDDLGLSLIITTGNRDPEAETRSIGLLLNRRVDALILIGSGLDHEPLQRLLTGGPPTVLIERECGGADVATIALGNREGARTATEHLIAKGHTRIAHVAGIRGAGQQRLDGYLDALKGAGLPTGPILHGDFTEASGRDAARLLFERPDVSAVFSANDRMALGIYHEMNRAGRHIPEHLSIVGFDDLSWGAFLAPPLTTVRQPAREIGRLAAREALAGMTGRAGSRRHDVPAELIERSSVRDLVASRPEGVIAEHH